MDQTEKLTRKNASFGFDPEENRKVDNVAGSMAEKEPAYHGETTPEGPFRVKQITSGWNLGQSPHFDHVNPDVNRREPQPENRRVRQLNKTDFVEHHSPSLFQTGHGQGHHALRLDAYLRQALTSPYNQRVEKHSFAASTPSERHNSIVASHADSRSASKEGSLVYSPSLWREGVGLIQSSPQTDGKRGPAGEGTQTWSGDEEHGPDHLHTFKTPLKSVRRAMFSSPERARREKAFSESCSPCSSASGSSSSGHHSAQANPFEHNQDRLHFPIFSPNMFNVPNTPESAKKETFQWNLEHLAEIQPVHIDEKEIKRQLSRHCHDEETEKRAQKAIEYYFQHHMVAPSPWNEVPPPHVLPLTPYGPGYDDLLSATPNQAQGSIQKDLPRAKKNLDKCCQTTLTLPMDLDLENLLGQYMTYQETEQDDSGGRDSLSSSSLRRKLFFNADSSSILSPVRSGPKSPDHISAALSTPPNCKTTPEWERGSPIHTPSSLQFSSSPIRGPSRIEGDYFRSSFNEHGPLASPELSPIADKHQGAARLRQSLDFPSTLNDTQDGVLELGSPIRPPFQVEVHDGSSPRRRPSPDVSPIAAFGSGGSGHHSRSRTLRAADISHTMFPSPQHTSPHPLTHSSPSPSPNLPFSSHTEPQPAHRDCVSMDTDSTEFLPHTDKEPGAWSLRENSMMDVMCGEIGSSGLDPDTLQNPSSVSYPDTGYQTGSGNGSLQTTQEGGVSITTNTSTEAPTSSLTDIAALLKKPAVTLNTSVNHNVFRALSDDGAVVGSQENVGTVPDESSVDGAGTSVDAGTVVHSNLTTQFMSWPLHSQLSTDSTDLSLQSLRGASVDSHSLGDSHKIGDSYKIGDSHKTGNILKFGDVLKATEHNKLGKIWHRQDVGDRNEPGSPHVRLSDSVDPQEFNTPSSVWDKELSLNNVQAQSITQFTKEDMLSIPQDSRIFQYDADLLNKMGEYLEKGGEWSDDGVDKGVENLPPVAASQTSKKVSGKLADDSVLERARQYLASVNYDQSEGRGEIMDSTPRAENADVFLSTLKPIGSSTPTKKLLRKVAEDLGAGVDKSGSPALASEVASEILRRAQLDLKRVDRSSHKKVNS